MKRFFLFPVPALLLAFNCAHAQTMSLDGKQSQIKVAVSATIDSFTGQLEKYQADIDWPRHAILPDKASVSFDFKDLKTGNPKRDQAMLTWLDHSSQPDCTFTLTGWEMLGTTNYAKGTITIHGVKREIAMPVTVEHNGTTGTITGTADLNYRDFNLPIIRKMLFLTVDPHLHVLFHLAGTVPAK